MQSLKWKSPNFLIICDGSLFSYKYEACKAVFHRGFFACTFVAMLKPVSPCIHSLFHGNSFSVVQLIIISPLIFVNNLDSPSWKFPWSSVYCFFISIEEGCLQIHQNFSSQLRRLDKIICAGFGSEVRRSLGLSHVPNSNVPQLNCAWFQCLINELCLIPMFQKWFVP